MIEKDRDEAVKLKNEYLKRLKELEIRDLESEKKHTIVSVAETNMNEKMKELDLKEKQLKELELHLQENAFYFENLQKEYDRKIQDLVEEQGKLDLYKADFEEYQKNINEQFDKERYEIQQAKLQLNVFLFILYNY